jgi:hypothetical protein
LGAWRWLLWTDDPPDLAPGPPGGPRLNVTPIFRASKRGRDGLERGERARYPRSGFCLACVSTPDNRTARAAHPLDNICPGDAATSCTPTNRFGRRWIAIKPATIARVAKVRRSLLVDAIAGDDRHLAYGSKRLSICRDLCFDGMALAQTPVKLFCIDRRRIATGHAGDLR